MRMEATSDTEASIDLLEALEAFVIDRRWVQDVRCPAIVAFHRLRAALQGRPAVVCPSR